MCLEKTAAGLAGAGCGLVKGAVRVTPGSRAQAGRGWGLQGGRRGGKELPSDLGPPWAPGAPQRPGQPLRTPCDLSGSHPGSQGFPLGMEVAGLRLGVTATATRREHDEGVGLWERKRRACRRVPIGIGTEILTPPGPIRRRQGRFTPRALPAAHRWL